MTILGDDMADTEFRDFRDFYPYYLSEHSDRKCRRMHFIGSWLVLGALASAVWFANPWLLLLVPVFGYGFAWLGHYLFEHNRPATFTHPLYSLMGDWVMFWHILTGRVRI